MSIGILALDAATEACSVALSVDGQVIDRYVEAPRKHAELLLPMVDELLAEAQIGLSDLDVIAVGQGPGAFTGVRIAISVAQGLAFGAGLPVLNIPTLRCMAQRAYEEQGVEQVLVAIDARMDEVYWGAYRVEQGVAQPVITDRVCKPEAVEVPDDISVSESWSGIGTGWAYRDRMSIPMPSTIVDPWFPSARAMLSLAQSEWDQGRAVPAADARPLYLRDQVVAKKG